MELYGKVVGNLAAGGNDVEAANESLVSGSEEGVDVVFLEGMSAIVELTLDRYEWLRIKLCWIRV